MHSLTPLCRKVGSTATPHPLPSLQSYILCSEQCDARAHIVARPHTAALAAVTQHRAHSGRTVEPEREACDFRQRRHQRVGPQRLRLLRDLAHRRLEPPRGRVPNHNVLFKQLKVPECEGVQESARRSTVNICSGTVTDGSAHGCRVTCLWKECFKSGAVWLSVVPTRAL